MVDYLSGCHSKGEGGVMPAPTCVHCERGYERIRSGVYLVEHFNDPPQPYKVWSADLWKCPQCQQQTVMGYGMDPLMEHYEQVFNEWFSLLLQNKAIMVLNQYER